MEFFAKMFIMGSGIMVFPVKSLIRTHIIITTIINIIRFFILIFFFLFSKEYLHFVQYLSFSESEVPHWGQYFTPFFFLAILVYIFYVYKIIYGPARDRTLDLIHFNVRNVSLLTSSRMRSATELQGHKNRKPKRILKFLLGTIMLLYTNSYKSFFLGRFMEKLSDEKRFESSVIRKIRKLDPSYSLQNSKTLWGFPYKVIRVGYLEEDDELALRYEVRGRRANLRVNENFAKERGLSEKRGLKDAGWGSVAYVNFDTEIKFEVVKFSFPRKK